MPCASCCPTTRATSPATRSSSTAAPRSPGPSATRGSPMTTWCRLEVDGTPRFGFVEGDCVTLVAGSPFDTWTPTRIHCGPHDFRLLVPVVPGNDAHQQPEVVRSAVDPGGCPGIEGRAGHEPDAAALHEAEPRRATHLPPAPPGPPATASPARLQAAGARRSRERRAPAA